MAFINKSFDGKLNKSVIDNDIEQKLKLLFEDVGLAIDCGNVKDGIQQIFDFISFANKYFDEKQPWVLAKTDTAECNHILFNCVNIIYNINTLLKPYLPFSCEKVENYLGNYNFQWKYERISTVSIKKDISPLYERYDKSVIAFEREKLKK